MLLFAKKNNGTGISFAADGTIEILLGEKRNRLNLPPLTPAGFDDLLAPHLGEYERATLSANGSISWLLDLAELGLVRASVVGRSATFFLPPIEAPVSNTEAGGLKGFLRNRLPQLLNIRVGIFSKKFVFTRLFPMPFFVAGLVVIYFAGNNLKLALESNRWPSTMGKIEHSRVKEKSSTGSSRIRTLYSASIGYRYTASKVQYVGDRVDFGSAGSIWTSTNADAWELVSRYPVGEEVRVYYDPNKPTESVLEPGFTTRSWLGALAGLVFLSVGLTCFFYPTKLIRRSGGVF